MNSVHSKPIESKASFHALAGFRWIAALVVGVAHLPSISQDPSIGKAFNRLLSEGMYGVTYFFVLSGFVLAIAYHQRLARPTRSTLREYYVSRIARIWPLHLLTLGLAVFYSVSPWPGGWGPFIANAFLVQSWIPNLEYIQSYNSVTWTLSLEVFFYLAFPLILFTAMKWRTATAAKLTLAAATIWATTASLVWYLAKCEGFMPMYIGNVFPIVRGGDFAVGVLLGLAFIRSQTSSGQATTRLLRWSWTAAEAGAVALVVILILRSHKFPYLFRLNGYYSPAIALVVLVFARERGYISQILASRPSVYLSKISFTFYMLHPLVFTHVYPSLIETIGAWPMAGMRILATVIFSSIIYHLFETPIRNWILKREKSKHQSSTDTLQIQSSVSAYRRAA